MNDVFNASLFVVLKGQIWRPCEEQASKLTDFVT